MLTTIIYNYIYKNRFFVFFLFLQIYILNYYFLNLNNYSYKKIIFSFIILLILLINF